MEYFPLHRPIDWFPALGVKSFQRRNPGYEPTFSNLYDIYQGASSLVFLTGLLVGPYVASFLLDK